MGKNPPSCVIRTAAPSDFKAIGVLNRSEVQHTSAMDAARLARLDAISCYHKVIEVHGDIAAFLLAMCSGAEYENVNFDWFSRRYTRFIYIDRIVVSSVHRGIGLASRLYEDMFRHARLNEIPVVACEYNVIPLNEPSRLFHDKWGFKEQGTQWLNNGTKCVSLQIAEAGQVTLDG